MPVSVDWGDPERTIIHFRFTAEWTQEELNTARGLARTMLNELDHDVGLILEFPSAVLLPPGILPASTRPR